MNFSQDGWSRNYKYSPSRASARINFGNRISELIKSTGKTSRQFAERHFRELQMPNEKTAIEYLMHIRHAQRLSSSTRPETRGDPFTPTEIRTYLNLLLFFKIPETDPIVRQLQRADKSFKSYSR